MNDLEKLGYEIIDKSSIKESSVTTEWGVEWDHDFIARDILQNFRDANKHNIDDIKISTTKNKIKVSGNEVFDLERLFWLGSKKTESDIGQYGEGFKAAIVSLLKLYPKAGIIASSGDQAVKIVEGEKNKAGFKPLTYHFYKIKYQDNSLIHINKVDEDLTKAFEYGMKHFWSDKHAWRMEEITPKGYQQKFKVYTTNQNNGSIFYRGLLRAEIIGIPIILVTDEIIKGVESKIASDRDRNVFNAKVSQSLYLAYSRDFMRYYDSEKIDFIIDMLRISENTWPTGSPFLSSLARKLGKQGIESIRPVFEGKKYYAKVYRYRYSNLNPEDMRDLYRIEDEWEDSGHKCCPEYFNDFGLHSSYSKLMEMKKNHIENERNKGTRAPNKKEKQLIKFGIDLAKNIFPSAKNLIDAVETKYIILKSDQLLGELVTENLWKRKQLVEVYLSESLFKGSFGNFLSVLLHEHSHIVGYDGERQFSDMLTKIISESIDGSKNIARFKKEWDQIR